MITSRIYRDGTLEDERPFEPAEIEACLSARDRRIWIDVVDPTPEELRQLQGSLGLHELSVEDSIRWGQRAKVEFYPQHLFVALHGFALGASDELVDSELHLFAGDGDYLLTIRREPLLDLSTTLARSARPTAIAHEGIGFHLYLLFDEVVDDYLNVVDRLEDRSDDLEDRVFRDEETGDLQLELFRLRRRVAQFRRGVAPMREVLDLIAEQGGVATPALQPYFRDVQDHVIRSIELIDNIRELLSSALEARLAQASNRLNVVMKQLSAWAAIILLPTLIAGIYGMNFEHMPELDWRLGYPLSLGSMAVTSFALYRVFKRKDWL
ncbi:MAG: magnesium/cobalt transporter CorA [Actinomycetota bacterium]